MSRLLGCPQCRAEFAFDDWARARSCPACGRQLTFFEASAAAPPAAPASGVPATLATAAPAAASPPSALAGGAWTWSERGGAAAAVAAPPVAAPPVAAPPAEAPVAVAAPGPVAAPLPGASLRVVAPVAVAAPGPVAAPLPGASLPVAAPVPFAVSGRSRLTIGGKPLQWSRAWTIVLAIWVAVAAGLIAVRVEMGPVTVMTPTEHAAVGAVRAIRLPTGAATETVLRYAATHDLTLEGHVAKIPPAARRCGTRSTALGSIGSTSTPSCRAPA